jgi:AraC family transcriptional regulator
MPNNVVYTKRFNAVLAYIDANLEGDLSVKTLSHVANFSVFHFHRQFTAFFGVPVSRYVQLMRLRRAAHRLAALPDLSVLDAALDAGFESPEAFSRAFRRAVGMTPSAFRMEPKWHFWNAVFAIPHFSRSIIMQVKIVEFPEVRVAALEHCGSARLLDESVRKFIEWRIQSGQSPGSSSPASSNDSGQKTPTLPRWPPLPMNRPEAPRARTQRTGVAQRWRPGRKPGLRKEKPALISIRQVDGGYR